jgi:large subunit ribosomal protein L32
MAEPKKRTNNSKQGMRRMHDKIISPSLDYCPNCHQPKERHIVCYNCGIYKKSQVIEKKK